MVKFLLLAFFVITSHCASAAQDPTAPLGWLSASEKPKRVQYNVPVLQSIVCKKDSPCIAILNDKVISSGESINGYRINSIDEKKVTLTRGSKTWHLGKRSPRYLDLLCLKKHVQFIDQKRSGTVSSQRLT